MLEKIPEKQGHQWVEGVPPNEKQGKLSHPDGTQRKVEVEKTRKPTPFALLNWIIDFFRNLGSRIQSLFFQRPSNSLVDRVHQFDPEASEKKLGGSGHVVKERFHLDLGKNRRNVKKEKNVKPLDPHLEKIQQLDTGLSERQIKKIDKFINKNIDSAVKKHGSYIKKGKVGLPRTIQVADDGTVIVHLKTKKVKALGQGHFKKATRSIDWKAGQLRANTVMHLQELTGDEMTLEDREYFAANEQNAARAIKAADPSRTSHLVRPVAVGAYKVGRKNKKNVVVELCSGGLMKSENMPGKKGSLERWKLFHQAMQGVQQFHELGFVHRDLKGDNIFLTKDDQGETLVKVADFDLSCRADSNGMCCDDRNNGSGITMAPEVLKRWQGLSGQKYGQQCDVFSMGVVALEVVFEHPLDRMASERQFLGHKIGNRRSNEVTFDAKELWSDLGLSYLVEESGPDRAIREVIVAMLNPDPSERMFLSYAITEIGKEIAQWESRT